MTLRVQDLHFSYGPRPILEGISFEIERGTLNGLFGPNGSGKTTLFRCFLGLLRIEAGEIALCDHDISRLTVREKARLIGYVPQEHRPPFPYKVKEIVLMGRTPHMNGNFYYLGRNHGAAVAGALETLGILHLADERYDQLSGGQRQLVLIARAMAQQTPILILDEPTSALDFSNQIRIWQILRRLAGQGTTVIACSHDPNHLLWFADRVLALNRGRIVADGPPATVLGEPVLDSFYREACALKELDGTLVVVPRVVAESRVQGEPESHARGSDLVPSPPR